MLICTKCLKFRLTTASRLFGERRGAEGNGTIGAETATRPITGPTRDRHKMSVRANNIRKRYGLTVDQYDDMIAKGCGVWRAHQTGRS